MAGVKSLGLISSTTPGHPVPITTTLNLGARAIFFVVDPSNAGVVWVLKATAAGPGSAGLDITKFALRAGCLCPLPKPSSATTGPFTSFSLGGQPQDGLFILDHYYIDVESSGDGVIVSYTTP